MAQTVERSADEAAHRPAFSVSRGQQVKATRRSREDRAAGKLACRRASLDSQADLRLDPLVFSAATQLTSNVRTSWPAACRSPDQGEMLMASDARAPIDLYIAAYSDPDEARWVTEVEKTLSHAEKVTKHEVDRDSVEQVKTTVNPSPS
jgi:hypothetical protein